MNEPMICAAMVKAVHEMPTFHLNWYWGVYSRLWRMAWL